MLPFRSGRIVLGRDFCGRRAELTRLSKTLVEEAGIALLASVRRAMNGLIKKRLVLRDQRVHRVCDPFFAAWIRARGM